MDLDVFRRLLYESESDALDFKREQYKFVNGDDSSRSELLKDILGFANAWRRTDAFILLGVEEVKGGPSEVVGISENEHLSDHTLQQFVNSRTNRPVLFHYHSLVFEGRHVGVIQINLQERPIFLKRDCGKLRRNEVYVRRGSSTDPQRPADPDEVARMGSAGSIPSAALDIAFAHTERKGPLGAHVSWESEWCVMPDEESIPDLRDERAASSRFGLTRLENPLQSHNRDFFRELATYEKCRRLCRAYRFWVKNVGETVATRVRLEIDIPQSDELFLFDASEFPDPPTEVNEITMHSLPERFASALGRVPGELTLTRATDGTFIEVEFGDIQPGREIHSELVFIGRRSSGLIAMSGKAYADNLLEPMAFTLSADVAVTRTAMTVDELVKLEIPRDRDE